MARMKYQIYGFSWINDENDMNVLNGTKGADWDEIYDEFNIACFNGIAYFKTNCGCYKMLYPRLCDLDYEGKCMVERNSGYIPEAGEYGAICSTFGKLIKISEAELHELSKKYHINRRDYRLFDWLNGCIK